LNEENGDEESDNEERVLFKKKPVEIDSLLLTETVKANDVIKPSKIEMKNR